MANNGSYTVMLKVLLSFGDGFWYKTYEHGAAALGMVYGVGFTITVRVAEMSRWLMSRLVL